MSSALGPGVRLGSYEVTAKLGEGGMGEVYRATDTRLKREVAIKVLPEAFTEDPERLARFEREAQVLAQLQHPNIGSIYGLEESDGVRALVMELAPGPTLAERLGSGALELDESLGIAGRIAEALEAAHAKGIVHRDLKPQNVKVPTRGAGSAQHAEQVKVLDFGLAKAVEPERASGTASDIAASPTLTLGATRKGVILGTAAYMSPEQAKGHSVDKRSDIWAFGVVLYEMLTGRQPFAAATVAETLSAVLTRDVDLSLLPDETPASVRRLLRRCLERDPARRLRDIGDARLELEERSDDPAGSPSVSGARSGRTVGPWLIAAIALGVAAWSLATRQRADPPPPSGHFTIDLPAGAELVVSETPSPSEGPLTVSPDGRRVVFVSAEGDGPTRLFVRDLIDPTPRALPGTEGARFPFFSPDGEWVGFFADGKLRKSALSGGSPTTLADAPEGHGASWGPYGEIVFAPTCCSTLQAVAETGGPSRELTRFDFALGEDAHRWPQFIPGRRALLIIAAAWSRETSDVYLLDLETGERRLVEQGVTYARYSSGVDDSSGRLLFVRGGTMMAAPFDLDAVGGIGPPAPIVEGVRDSLYDVSPAGVLVYVPGTAAATDYSLVWVDRDGRETAINDLRRGYEDLHLSPDGRFVALTVEEAGWLSPAHVWLADTGKGTLSRLTFEGYGRDPVWAPDGESIVYGSKRSETEFGLYRQRVDGRTPAERLWESPIPIWPDPQSFTPDGRTLVFTTRGEETGDDIWTLRVEEPGSAAPWLATSVNEWAGRLSPDGRFMAYNADDESGRHDVYVRAFPEGGGRWQVSQGGGVNPIWSRDGRELFFRREKQILAVDVDTSAGFVVGQPRVLFSGRYFQSGRDYDVSPDGDRFVMMRNDDPRTASSFRIVLDWKVSSEAAEP